jgi:hypothetical protein
VDEGDDGVPEDQVRLDEAPADVGGTLFYTYDFGDNWRPAARSRLGRDRTDRQTSAGTT